MVKHIPEAILRNGVDGCDTASTAEDPLHPRQVSIARSLHERRVNINSVALAVFNVRKNFLLVIYKHWVMNWADRWTSTDFIIVGKRLFFVSVPLFERW